jgi:hypothetical protein
MRNAIGSATRSFLFQRQKANPARATKQLEMRGFTRWVALKPDWFRHSRQQQ